MTKPVAGFSFAAVAAGVRKDGRIDTAIAVADEPVPVAGLFTRNLVKAAPVQVAQARVLGGMARAVLVNSGNANACTGPDGFLMVERTTAALAEALGVPPELVLPASTGVIGALLPGEKIVAKVPELVAAARPEGWEDFAGAIMTTDQWRKVASAELPGGATVLGLAKGAGMIHPDVGPPHATMLVFLFTDAVSNPPQLQEALQYAADRSFNAATVDGDTSTNDTVLLMASGKSGVTVTDEALAAGVHAVCWELARSMVRDGEGAEHLVELRVSGLADEAAARQVAQTVATSLLVKTAIFGRDANWGRLLAAAGRAGVPFDPTQARISIEGVEIVRNGTPVGAEAEAEAGRLMREREELVIELSLGSGLGAFRYLTSDLGHKYVDVNAGYRS